MFGEEYVNTGTSIDVASDDNPTNEPEPNIIVFTRPYRDFVSRTLNQKAFVSWWKSPIPHSVSI